MSSVIFGISMLTHITIIAAVKSKNFLDFALFGRKSRMLSDSKANMALTSLAIAAITEFVILLVFISFVAILEIGLTSQKSNYKIIQSAFNEFENKSVELDCLFKEKCGYERPDVSIPLS